MLKNKNTWIPTTQYIMKSLQEKIMRKESVPSTSYIIKKLKFFIQQIYINLSHIQNLFAMNTIA